MNERRICGECRWFVRPTEKSKSGVCKSPLSGGDFVWHEDCECGHPRALATYEEWVEARKDGGQP